MAISAWIPLKSLDDNLLALESAALFSLFDPEDSEMLGWILSSKINEKFNETDFTFGNSPAPVEPRLIQKWLHMSGFILPSLAAGKLCFDPKVALQECAKRIDSARAERGQSIPHIALAFLNLCVSLNTWDPKQFGGSTSQTIWDAFRQIRNYLVGNRVEVLSVIDRSEPKMTAPNLTDWNAFEEEWIDDYAPWTSGLGAMFQTLTGWNSVWSMPPRPTNGEKLEWVAYWAPLPTLTIGVLGWSDPALGLARWILLGMPKTTPELALLSRQWGADALMYFCHPQMDWDSFSGYELGLQHSGSMISSIYENSHRSLDFSECGSLHMSTHLYWQLFEGKELPSAGRGKLFRQCGEANNSSYVLQLAKYGGWLARLQQIGRDVPTQRDEALVEVTVLAAPIGQLGTFRQCKITGLWHATADAIHLLGHADVIESSVHSNQPVCESQSQAHIQPFRIAPQYSKALIFWIASEIARRHPGYWLHYQRDAHTIATIDVFYLRHATNPVLHLYRDGTVGSAGSTPFVHTVAELFAYESARELIELVERSLGLASPMHAAPTNRHNLMYRTMSELLNMTVHRKEDWDFLPASNYFVAEHPWKDFLNAVPMSESSSPRGIPWILLRDNEPVALLTPDGVVRSTRKYVDLLDSYCNHSRRISSMIGDVFGDLIL